MAKSELERTIETACVGCQYYKDSAQAFFDGGNIKGLTVDFNGDEEYPDAIGLFYDNELIGHVTESDIQKVSKLLVAADVERRVPTVTEITSHQLTVGGRLKWFTFKLSIDNE